MCSEYTVQSEISVRMVEEPSYRMSRKWPIGVLSRLLRRGGVFFFYIHLSEFYVLSVFSFSSTLPLQL